MQSRSTDKTKTVRARYTLELKQEAVRLVTCGQSIAAAAIRGTCSCLRADMFIIIWTTATLHSTEGQGAALRIGTNIFVEGDPAAPAPSWHQGVQAGLLRLIGGNWPRCTPASLSSTWPVTMAAPSSIQTMVSATSSGVDTFFSGESWMPTLTVAS